MEKHQNGGQCNVYVWFDRKDPFYVGIGGEKRLKSKYRNKWAMARRRESELRGDFRQEVVFTGQRSSCETIETHLIFCWGSVVNNGILFNFTPGGDGMKDTYNIPPESLLFIKEGRIRGGKTSMLKNHSVKNDQGKSEFAVRAGNLSANTISPEEKKDRSKKALEVLHSSVDSYGRSLHGLKSPFSRNKRRTQVTKIDTGEIFEFDSAHLAAKTLGLNRGDLCSCARGEIPSVKGYTAKYIRDPQCQ